MAHLAHITMSSISRALAHAPKSVLSPSFSRSFSAYHAVQGKGDYVGETAKLRQQDPVALRQLMDRKIWYRDRWLMNPENVERMREVARSYALSRKGDQRLLFSWRFRQWCTRHAWFRENLPWKSFKPVLYERKVEHHCEGCDWTKKGGRKLWWKKIQSSTPAPATETDSWLCTNCYIPKAADWEEAMPRGYEDLTTMEEIAKRRDQLGHGS